MLIEFKDSDQGVFSSSVTNPYITVNCIFNKLKITELLNIFFKLYCLRVQFSKSKLILVN